MLYDPWNWHVYIHLLDVYGKCGSILQQSRCYDGQDIEIDNGLFLS